MENKYFTPDVEDIRINYEAECNVRYKAPYEDNWVYVKFKGVDAAVREYHKKGLYRVPYLTKEQIEAEGWKNYENNKFEKLINEDSYYILSLNENHQIVITKSFIKGWSWQWSPYYGGECKDINTFRYICKLLNI